MPPFILFQNHLPSSSFVALPTVIYGCRWLLMDSGWFVLFLSEIGQFMHNIQDCIQGPTTPIQEQKVLNDFIVKSITSRYLHPMSSIYNKRDDFNFHITNFPFLSSNIPSSPAYGVFTSQLIRYVRACSSYECFILRARRLSSKLLKQGYLVERLKSSFRKFYGRYGDLIQQYEVTFHEC